MPGGAGVNPEPALQHLGIVVKAGVVPDPIQSPPGAPIRSTPCFDRDSDHRRHGQEQADGEKRRGGHFLSGPAELAGD